MKLLNEDQILDEGFRKSVIKEILSPENVGRKKESFKRYEIYKDKARKYVIESLTAEGLGEETLKQMENRAANISICRKVINKLARTYSGGVIRETVKPEDLAAMAKAAPKPGVTEDQTKVAEVSDEQPQDTSTQEPELDQDPLEAPEGGAEAPVEGEVIESPVVNATDLQISELARLLCFDEKMKKGDRYRELQKNMLFQVVPERITDEGEDPAYKLVLRTLLPWQYDVIEDARDREQLRVVILSDYGEGKTAVAAQSEAQAAVHNSSNVYKLKSDGIDNTIADAPSDANKGDAMRFVWWSNKYHFTTDGKGQIIADLENPNNENPIELVPFVNNADEQDGQFWAEGGDDLIEGSILVNKMITDMNYIAYSQGWGQWVITGKNLSKKNITLGPLNAMLLDWDPSNNDPEPKANVVSANPPLESWMRMVEQYVALLLTTNNLSPGSISMKLDANNFPAGIALMIEKSEATDDVTDKQKSYKDIERSLWKRVIKWHNLYLASGELAQEFIDIGKVDETVDLSIKFNEVKPVATETEKLNTLKLRKELGLNTEIELLMIDNPDLTVQDAEKKLLKIKEQKLKNMATFGAPPGAQQPEGEDEEKDKGDKPAPPPFGA